MRRKGNSPKKNRTIASGESVLFVANTDIESSNDGSTTEYSSFNFLNVFHNGAW